MRLHFLGAAGEVTGSCFLVETGSARFLVDYGAEVRPHESVRCVFRDAGHILGSAIIEVWVTGAGRTRKLVFSGDLGQPGHPIVQEVEESIALNRIREGAIIISASGMCDAGRIKYHLKLNLPRPECTILITGFQAAGTLGRRLVDGARRVRIFGEEVPVRADIYTIGGLSAHADQGALLNWLGHFERAPGQTWIVHGEPSTAAAFADAVRERLGWSTNLPQRGASASF